MGAVDIIDERHLCILEDYPTAHALNAALHEADDLVCEALSNHVQLWVERNLGQGWEGKYSLSNDSEIYFWKRSWFPDSSSENSQSPLAYFWFGLINDEEEDAFWLTHLAGMAKEPFSAAICLEEMIESLDKQVALDLCSDLSQLLVRMGYAPVTKNKKDLYFKKRLQVLPNHLSENFRKDDLAHAFSALTEVLQEYREVIPQVEQVVIEAKRRVQK